MFVDLFSCFDICVVHLQGLVQSRIPWFKLMPYLRRLSESLHSVFTWGVGNLRKCGK